MFKYWKLLKKKDKRFILVLIFFNILATVFAFLCKKYICIFFTISFFINILCFYMLSVYEYLIDESHANMDKLLVLNEELLNDNEKMTNEIQELKKALSKVKRKNKEEK